MEKHWLLSNKVGNGGEKTRSEIKQTNKYASLGLLEHVTEKSKRQYLQEKLGWKSVSYKAFVPVSMVISLFHL